MMASISVKDLCLDYPVFAPLVAEEEDKHKDTGLQALPGAGALLPKGKLSKVEALRGISFNLKAGDRLGIIGLNGSGKSTLLRVLAGVYEPTSGSVAIEGEIAPLFSVGLGTRAEATGRRNIILRGLLRGLTRRQAEAKVDEIIEFSELGRFIDLPVRTYSQGMAMRLSFAIATAFRPEILLLDEWIGAGDQKFREKAAARMHELVDQAGITVIASHNRKLLRQVCDQAIWLERGEIRAIGPINEVYAQVDSAPDSKASPLPQQGRPAKQPSKA